MRAPKSANGGMLWTRRTYLCIDKDPEIDRFRTLWQQNHLKERDLAVLAGLHTSTVANMFGGDTRQPRHSTFAKMAGAMGYEYDLVRKREPDFQKEIPKARAEFKTYQLTLAAMRTKPKKKAERKTVAK